MRNPMLQRLLTAYRLELRLICLHWSYGLLQAGWAAYIILNFSNNGYQLADTTLFTLSLGVIPLVSLTAMLLTGVSASRAVRNRFDVLEAAYPVGTEVIIGRWLAITTATSGFLVVPLGVALARGPLDVFLRTMPIFLLETLTLFAFLSAAIWLIQVTIGIKRWIYPLFAMIWLGSAIVPATLSVERFPVALLLAFTAQGWLNVDYSAVWGRIPLGNLPLFYDLFYLALLLLVLALIVWRSHRHRFYRHSLTAVIIIVISLNAILITGRGYSLEVVVANHQENQRNSFILNHQQNVALPAEMPYAVRGYDITLDLSDIMEPRFQAQIEVHNRGDGPLTQIDLSLNAQLTLTEASLPYTRDGDFIAFTLPEALAPDETLPVNLTYEGALWYYGEGFIQGRPRKVDSFIRSGGVNLSCTAAWYPVPGRIIVGRPFLITGTASQSNLIRDYPDCILDEPVQVTLSVQNAGDLSFASNLTEIGENEFASSATTWVHLLGAPGLLTEDVEGMTLITAESLLDFARPLVTAHYLPALNYLRRFFPEIEGLTVFVVDGGFGHEFYQSATPIINGRLMVVVDPFYLAAFPRNPYNEYLFGGQAMINSLFGIGETLFRPQPGYVESIGYFLWAHHMAGGDPDTMHVLLTDGIPQGDVGRRAIFLQPAAERYPLAQLFYQVYVEQGEIALIDLLRAIRNESERLSTLSPEAANEWISEAAHAD